MIYKPQLFPWSIKYQPFENEVLLSNPNPLTYLSSVFILTTNVTTAQNIKEVMQFLSSPNLSVVYTKTY